MKMELREIKIKDILEYDSNQIYKKNIILNKYSEELILCFNHPIHQKFDFSSIIKWFNFLLLTNLTTLEAIGRSIAEDICILVKIDGKFRLIYTMVAFPNRWRPTEKIGKNISQIHSPIPNFENTAEKINNFLDFMPEYIPYRRENWGFTSVPDLYLPFDISKKDSLYLRKEIQTLIKIENYVIFLIKTEVKKMKNKNQLNQLSLNLSNEMKEYKLLHSKL
jgi:hypothetical protein